MMKFLLVMAFAAAGLGTVQQTDGDVSEDAFYTVAYVEIESSSRDTALAAFRAWQSASRTISGHVRFELFEEPNESGRFSIIETWASQGAFDQAGAAVQQDRLGPLDPIRVSDYDQRPYQPLTVASGPALQGGEDVIYIVAHVDVSPSPEVPPLLEQHALESRLDDGNIRFDVLQHTMRANHFTVIEGWRDAQAYRAHVEASHTRAYRNALGPFLGSPLDQRLYQAVDLGF